MIDDLLPEWIETVPEALAWWADRTPNAPALLTGAGHTPPLSYGELHQRTLALAMRLAAMGVGRGEAVAVDMTGDAGSVVSIFAAMQAGVALPLVPGAVEEDLAAAFAQLTPAAVIAARADAPAVRAARRANVPFVIRSGSDDQTGATFGPGSTHCAPHDLALILHSSGTTGRPRGIPRTHRNLLFAAQAYTAWMGRDAFTRTLMTTPPSFGMGANSLIATICAGGSVVLPPGSPAAIMQAIGHWQPTWAYVVPALLEAMLEEANQSASHVAAPWCAIAVAGMAPSPTLADRVAAVFGAPVREGYGCGEAGLIAGATGAQGAAPGVLDAVFVDTIVILDENGAATQPGVPGEIIVSGPQVSSGYLGDAEATAAAFSPNGAFRTGDTGYLDRAGRLHLIGRVKEIVNRGGEKLALAEIDAALLRHPAVLEAAAFAIPDGRLGEEVAAAIVLKPGSVATEREVRRDAASRLAPAKVPRRIWIVHDIPRTRTGKIRRAELSRLWQERQG